MHPHNLIIRTKLTPPRLHKRILPRPRLSQRLLEALDYRLTIVQAGTGYGKSTALASLAESEHPLVWYHLSEEDADPLVFLLHLFAGFRERFPAISNAPLAVLDDLDSNPISPGPPSSICSSTSWPRISTALPCWFWMTPTSCARPPS